MMRQGDEMVAANFLSGEKIEGDGCGDLGRASGRGPRCKDWLGYR
jgi:hypothetical protein